MPQKCESAGLRSHSYYPYVIIVRSPGRCPTFIPSQVIGLRFLAAPRLPWREPESEGASVPYGIDASRGQRGAVDEHEWWLRRFSAQVAPAWLTCRVLSRPGPPHLFPAVSSVRPSVEMLQSRPKKPGCPDLLLRQPR